MMVKRKRKRSDEKQNLMSKFRAVATPGLGQHKRALKGEEKILSSEYVWVDSEERSYVEAEGASFLAFLVKVVMNMEKAFVE